MPFLVYALLFITSLEYFVLVGIGALAKLFGLNGFHSLWIPVLYLILCWSITIVIGRIDNNILRKPALVICGVASALTVLSGLVYKHTTNYEWSGRTVQEERAGWPLKFISDNSGSPLSSMGVIDPIDWGCCMSAPSYFMNILFYAFILCAVYQLFSLIVKRGFSHKTVSKTVYLLFGYAMKYSVRWQHDEQ